LYALTSAYIALSTFYYSFPIARPDPSADPSWVIKFLKLLFYSEGVVSLVVRVVEPAFISGVKQTFKGDFEFVFCCFYKKNNELEREAIND
jgi:hypothetical protein